jgi:DNA-binding CsgD family transcriptional regulator
MRRHGSSPSAIDTDDLAVSVARPTLSSRPRAARGPDVAKAPLDPREAFVLSLVDGSMTAAEIADISGMSQADVLKTLQKLASLRLVAIA